MNIGISWIQNPLINEYWYKQDIESTNERVRRRVNGQTEEFWVVYAKIGPEPVTIQVHAVQTVEVQFLGSIVQLSMYRNLYDLIFW